MTAIKNPMTRLGVASSAVLLALGGEAFAASELKSDDFVGISFWLISMALIASTRGQYEVRPGLILVRKLQGRESVNLMETALLISREVARCARDAS